MSPILSTRMNVFISYSHADEYWLQQLKRHLKPLVREGSLHCWDDTHIGPGDDWQQEIRQALESAQVAVLLISADFFASDFINETELPPLLDAARAKGVHIIPVILSASRFARSPDLARYQSLNPPDRPLGEMSKAEQDKVLDHLAHTIECIFNKEFAGSAVSARRLAAPSERPDGTMMHQSPRIIRIATHLAHFVARPSITNLFINIVNLSETKDVEVTHVWLETMPKVFPSHKSRVLPVRLKPSESWETWVTADQIPPLARDDLFELARARLSTGEVFKSARNATVPEFGSVPGGPIK